MVEQYQKKKMDVADSLGRLYIEALKQRRISRAIELKERYAKLMEESEEGRRISESRLDQVDWMSEMANDFHFWIKQMYKDHVRFQKEEQLLGDDYRSLSAEYYEMKSVNDKSVRELRTVKNDFQEVVDGYRCV